MVSAETPSENGACAPNLYTIRVGDKSPTVIHSVLPVLGVTRYLCNALRNIITFVVTK